MPLPMMELITSAARPQRPMARTRLMGSRALTRGDSGRNMAEQYAQNLPPAALLRGAHALAYEQRRIRARTRTEFFRAAVIDFGEIEIAVRIDAHSMDIPQSAGPVSLAAPGIKIVAIDIELDDLGGGPVRDPDAAVGGHVKELRSRGFAGAPLIEELAIFVENLDAMVGPVGYEDAVSLRIEDHAVHILEDAWPRVVRRIGRLAEGHQEFAVFVELHDARIAVAIGDEDGPVRQPVDKGRTIEMLFVVARLIGRAERLDQLLAVVREFENGVGLIVHHPDVFIGIVRINGDVVRALENGIPFRPVFDELAVGVHHDDAVLPARVQAELAAPNGIACAGDRSYRGIAKGKLRNRKRNARTNFGVGNFLGALHGGNFAAFQDKNTVGAFREDALNRSKGPFIVPRQGCERLGPVQDDFVGAPDVLSILLS